MFLGGLLQHIYKGVFKMKVYIVTDGDYSEYGIQKVFSNIEAAEDYKYWHHITNEIEEYEVSDSWNDDNQKKYMYIRVMGKCYPEAVVDINYEIYPNMCGDAVPKHSVGIWNYFKYDREGFFTLYTYHLIPIENWDEQKCKDRYTKSLYDLNILVRAMLADGATWDMVNLALTGRMEEE